MEAPRRAPGREGPALLRVASDGRACASRSVCRRSGPRVTAGGVRAPAAPRMRASAPQLTEYTNTQRHYMCYTGALPPYLHIEMAGILTLMYKIRTNKNIGWMAN
ncbi:uncharacterized protein LOC124633760 isoform X3 [Helicoverpa zea]|uniref:uncharacterized protein LOC124633760 isoform X3 n=1 Tax=Helicoverpa zea TaxID=7113 RepID=UPI001F56A95E|nr:uncharacterized protein LOC124633760 isoform X3 [Helicoverpa zea]